MKLLLSAACFSLALSSFSYMYLEGVFTHYGMSICELIQKDYFETCYAFAKREAIGECLGLTFFVWCAFTVVFYGVCSYYSENTSK